MRKSDNQTTKTNSHKIHDGEISYKKQVKQAKKQYTVSLESLKFLAKVCGFKSYAKPYIIANSKGGHFTTSLAF
jgi:hypothetical protein